MSPISWAGTLMILNGVNNFSTASAKQGCGWSVLKSLKNTTMRINDKDHTHSLRKTYQVQSKIKLK